jgi:pyruvate/2-oxoglutarate dehydrogenase complex dihydrolipoamide acyltransferase (E2) component
MTFDMNDAELPRGTDLIPDGSFVKVRMEIRRGGIDGASEVDRGLLKAAKTPGSDVRLLDCEFTVVAGPHARRKFWQSFTVAGGKVDEQGVSIGWKISKGMFRAMIDSACGLDPKDMSETAKARRVLRGLADLSGITFAAKVRVEPASDPRYGDSNRLDRVVLPGEPEYPRIMAGEAVPARPSTRASRPAAPTAAAAPAWAPAASAPAAPRPWERPAAASPAQPAPQPAATPAATGPAWLNG